MWRPILVVMLAASCTRYSVVVRPSELASHAGELVRNGDAMVYGTDAASVRVSANDAIDVQVVDGDTQRPARLTVRELVAGCVPDVGSAACIANQVVHQPITVRREYRADRSRIATGLTFGVMGGAVGACIVACQGSAELQKDLAYAGVGALGAMALFALLAMLGGRD